jgi:hypothetical protein
MIQGKNVIDANNERKKRCEAVYEQAIASGVVPQIIPVVQRPIRKGTINKHDNRKLDGKTDIEKIRMTVQMFKSSTTAQIKDFAGIGRNKAIAMARILEQEGFIRIETKTGHGTKFIWTGKE